MKRFLLFLAAALFLPGGALLAADTNSEQGAGVKPNPDQALTDDDVQHWTTIGGDVWPGLKIGVGGQLQLWAIPWDQNEFTQNDPVVYGDPNLDEGFSVRRARLIVRGELSEWLGFGLQLDYDASYTGKGSESQSPTLDEAYLDFHREKLPHLKLGVDKVPLGGQQFSSSKRLLFVQRAIASEVLTFSRDMGVTLYDTYETGKDSAFGAKAFTWYVGAYNGSGTVFRDNNGVGDVPNATDALANPFGLAYVIRLEFDLGNVAGPRGESNLGKRSWSDVTLRFGANAAGNHQLESRDVHFGGDFGLYVGPLSLQFEALWKNTYPLYTDEGIPDVLSDIQAFGWFVQTGVFVLPDKLQLALRYEAFDGNKRLSDADDLQVVTAGLNYYPLMSDALKLQLDYLRRVETDEGIAVKNDSVYLNVGTYF